MKDLFMSYLYRLRHDITFKITLIIGGGLVLFLTLIYLGLSFLSNINTVSGLTMFISSLSPSSNFGLVVPVNLITFTVLEFNHGSIRNKIIAGHSKQKVYLSLFINGLVFTIALMTVYSLLSLGLGSFVGWLLSFNENLAPLDVLSNYTSDYLPKLIVIALLCYISIVSFTIFFATLFRNIGPSIPVVLLVIVFLSTAASIVAIFLEDNEGLLWTFRIIDPMFALGAGESTVVGQATVIIDGMEIIQDETKATISTETFVSGIISNLVYTGLFFGGGLLIFSKRDIK